MLFSLDIPQYDPKKGIKQNWADDFEIAVKKDNDQVVLIANKSGLVSLAMHLLTLAQDGVPSGYHLHYDEHSSLEEGSIELVVQKM